MSIAYVNELFLGRTASDTESSTTHTRVFQVETSDADVTSTDVLAAEGIPERGDEYPEGSNYFATKRTAVQTVDAIHWNVNVEYEFIGGISVGDHTDDPWDADPVVNFSFQKEDRVLEKAYKQEAVDTPPSGATPIGEVDRDNPLIPVVNSARQPFDPPAMIVHAMLMISIDRAIRGSAFDPEELCQEFINSINDAEVTIADTIIPPFCGFIQDIKASKAWTESNEEYWNLHFEILIDDKSFLKNIVDMGWYEIVDKGTSNEKLSPILDENGKAIKEPFLLNGAGQARPGDDVAEMHFLPFHGYWETDWSALVPNILPDSA